MKTLTLYMVSVLVENPKTDFDAPDFYLPVFLSPVRAKKYGGDDATILKIEVTDGDLPIEKPDQPD